MLGTLLKHSVGLETHFSTAPLLLNVVVELSIEVLLKRLQFGLVLLVHGSERNHSGVFLVGKSSESALSLHNGERNAHLAAQGGEPHNQLDGIDVVGDDNELGLLLLDKGGDVLKAILEDVGGRGDGSTLLGSGGLLISELVKIHIYI